MLIAARDAILAEDVALPYDKRVEWIACDPSMKGAYVTTGITNENGIRCVARVKCPLMSSKATPIGSVVFCGSTRFDINFITPDYSSSQVRIQYMWNSGGDGQGYTQQIAAPANEFFDMDCSIFNGKQRLVINNTVVASYTYALTSYSLDGSEIRMFNYHSPNSDRYAYNYIASFKLLNAQDEVIFDGIPCIKNGEPGFYDTVAGVFHGNSGTGSLIAGPDVSAPYIYIPSGQSFNLSEPLSDSDIAAGLLGNDINYASYSFDICVRMEGSPPTNTDYAHGLFGPRGVNTFGKYFGIYGRFATWYRDPAQGYNLSSLIYDGGWHTINLKKGSVSVDGTSHTYTSGSWPSSGLWQRFSVGAFSATTSPASVRSFDCYDGSNNLVFALVPTKDANGYGAFRDTVSGTICNASITSATMPTYYAE